MKKNQLLIDNLRTHILQSLENLEELLEQEDINLRTLRIKELEISFTVTRRTKSEYLKSLDFWYNPLTKLIILTSIAMALVVMAFPTNKFQPKTVWEHYCKYTLHIHLLS